MSSFNLNNGKIDLLYLRLKRDISKWYDKNGDSEAKAMHLHMLRKNYDPARFVGDIGLERVKFLTELQEMVDLRSIYGMAGLS